MTETPTMDGYTDYLYARPSWMDGAGRLLDLFGALNVYNTSPTGAQADVRALVADHLAIQMDFERAQQELTEKSRG